MERKTDDANVVTALPGGADFAPNPRRTIWIEGEFDQALLKRLAPGICALVAASREPITLFVDSHGGNTEVGRAILDLLRWNGDGRGSCRLIAVALANARSAAAHLLSAADFAIAAPECVLLHHGVRWELVSLIRGEHERKVRELPTLHATFALELCRSSVHRLLSTVSAFRALFAEHRAAAGDPSLEDLQCFLELLREKISRPAQKVLDRAVGTYARQDVLFREFRRRLRRGRDVTETHLRKLMLHACIAVEYQESRTHEPFSHDELARISEDFYFLCAYFEPGQLREWCSSPSTPQTLDADPEEDYFLPFRTFFLALCRELQQEENYITPPDAVWLGLIDASQYVTPPARALL